MPARPPMPLKLAPFTNNTLSSMLVILHNLRSSHNVGSIFRTADAVGVEKIYLCGITSAPVDGYGRPNTRLAKVSLGAEKSVAWEKAKSAGRLLVQLKRQGYNILAVEQAAGSVSLFKARPAKSASEKSALILGNEIVGLPDNILKQADRIIEIPMAGRKESLNVAVAFGIVVFWLNRNVIARSPALREGRDDEAILSTHSARL